ncbi:hypothetical protein MGU_10277 [Metarhizium guizhouense ARSEF 977]|uniref:F-box domain-containing protein n=1 Tax=Metarhizium guizhouense (strain ARSEF 977) TaxID=1276136 RepID=A0A0B4G6S6_METGA|nr:hypothetical protein MGU_10277 [Metarhizium guizhouense ARSEF 977]
MSLYKLPPETLTQIFDRVGPSFFHEDLGRLTVCKQWFEYALPVFFKRIKLSQKTLRSLVSSRVMKSPSLLQGRLEILELDLSGHHASFSTLYPQNPTSEWDILKDSSPNEAPREDTTEIWIKDLGNDLAQLTIIAQKSHRLSTLRIRASGYPSPQPLDISDDYLPLPAMQALLSMENLCMLVLDSSVSILAPSGEQGDSHHICPAIGTLLRTLRTLHVRMRTICPDVLKPQDPSENLHLSEVVINLSLTANLPGITSAAHSKQCGFQGGGLLQLKADIQEQAEALATKMASPKVIRILTHTLPQFETQSLDVFTGKTIILGDDMAWGY